MITKVKDRKLIETYATRMSCEVVVDVLDTKCVYVCSDALLYYSGSYWQYVYVYRNEDGEEMLDVSELLIELRDAKAKVEAVVEEAKDAKAKLKDVAEEAQEERLRRYEVEETVALDKETQKTPEVSTACTHKQATIHHDKVLALATCMDDLIKAREAGLI